MQLDRDRIAGGAAALLVQAALLAALYFGLMVDPATRHEIAAMLMIAPVAEAAPPAPVKRRAPRPSARAAPPAATAKATPIVVPPPVIPVMEIPPIIAADVAGIGAQSNQGAAAEGPGSGSGGQGPGTGSGDSGEGGGGGGTPAEWLKGRIRDSDYPREAMMAEMQGALVTRYSIGTDGRVTACEILKSSGSPVLDETTCRLVKQRFRFRPARDADGRKVRDTLIEEHAWIIR